MQETAWVEAVEDGATFGQRGAAEHGGTQVRRLGYVPARWCGSSVTVAETATAASAR
jgi:hypothetical protein